MGWGAIRRIGRGRTGRHTPHPRRMPGSPAVRARSQPQETPAPCAPRLGLLRGERSAFALSLRSAEDPERGEFVIPESASRLSGTHMFAHAISGITGRDGRLYRPCIIGDGIVRLVAFLADAGEAEAGMEFVRSWIVRGCVHFCHASNQRRLALS